MRCVIKAIASIIHVGLVSETSNQAAQGDARSCLNVVHSLGL